MRLISSQYHKDAIIEIKYKELHTISRVVKYSLKNTLIVEDILLITGVESAHHERHRGFDKIAQKSLYVENVSKEKYPEYFL